MKKWCAKAKTSGVKTMEFWDRESKEKIFYGGNK